MHLPGNFVRQMAIWRGLKSFGARDFSPENSSDEGLKSLAPTKTVARQTPHLASNLWDTCVAARMRTEFGLAAGGWGMV